LAKTLPGNFAAKQAGATLFVNRKPAPMRQMGAIPIMPLHGSDTAADIWPGARYGQGA
jgi:hypothetical protein